VIFAGCPGAHREVSDPELVAALTPDEQAGLIAALQKILGRWRSLEAVFKAGQQAAQYQTENVASALLVVVEIGSMRSA